MSITYSNVFNKILMKDIFYSDTIWCAGSHGKIVGSGETESDVLFNHIKR